LSKVIKANKSSPSDVTLFDFGQMDLGKGSSAPRRSAGVTDATARSAETDPLAQIETTIQNRLLDAERKAQEMEEDAYRQGYAQGQKDGYEIGQKSMAIVRDHLEKLLYGLARFPEQLFAEYREWIIHSCLEIARHVVRRELRGDEQQLIQLIDSLLHQAEEGHSLTIHLHPHDLDLLEKHLDFQELVVSRGQTLHLKADPQIERGGCRMESDIQVLDASLEQQFALIEDAIRTQQILSNNSSA
jgi:flagellar assembly protein FliH